MKFAGVSLMVAAVIVLCSQSFSHAQYNTGYAMTNSYGYGGGGGYGGYGGGGESADADDRPKVQLGIRLKIPAFKFELPRLSLPKITVSAKIRQPDRPRTITLPEINLDTSSKVEPPGSDSGSDGGGGYYHAANTNQGYAANQNQMSYSSGQGNGGDHTSTFSFSAHDGYSQPSRYGNKPTRYQSPVSQSHHTYSSTNLRPTYWTDQRDRPSHPRQYTHHQLQQPSQYPAANPDVGFNAPVYVEPNAQVGQGDQPAQPDVSHSRQQQQDNFESQRLGAYWNRQSTADRLHYQTGVHPNGYAHSP